jgi:dinuclear metal center YbgI/SA1388 family protein
MKIKEITDHLEKLAPLHYAQNFDNVGLLVGDSNTAVTGVLITLDCLENVVDEAIETGCNLIVTFHPIIFSGLKHLRGSDYVRKTIIKAIKNDIAIYATHTALDMAIGGVSHRMAQELGLKNVKTLIPEKNIIKKIAVHVLEGNMKTMQEAMFKAGGGHLANYEECSFTLEGTGSFKGNNLSNPHTGKPGERSVLKEQVLEMTYLPHLEKAILRAMRAHHPYEEIAFEISTLENEYQEIGMGAIGDLEKPITVEEFLQFVKLTFKSGVVKSSLSRKRTIQKVAVLGGSGAFAIHNAKSSGADAYITADLKYHDFFQGEDLLLCDVGHYESEQFTKNLLHEYLIEKFSNFAILCAQTQTNPVNYI